MRLKKAGIILVACAVLLTGCGAQDAAGYIKNSYNLENVEGQGQSMQKVYRAEGKSVPQVAADIAAQDKPDEMSSNNDEHMFLVYDDSVVHVQQDTDNKSDTLVEVNTKQFVRDNYDPSFLSTFMTAALISSMFGNNWGSYPSRNYHGYGDYKYNYKKGTPGYTTPRGGYTPPATSPSTKQPTYKTPPRSGSGTGKVVRKKR